MIVRFNWGFEVTRIRRQRESKESYSQFERKEKGERRGLNLPVHGFVVAFRGDDFRGEIIRSSAKRPSDIRNLLGETKIGNFQVTMTIKQEILRLQVTIDDLMMMQILEGKSDFCSVELGDWIGESLLRGRSATIEAGARRGRDRPTVGTHLGFSQETEELATLDKVHNHVEVARILPSTP